MLRVRSTRVLTWTISALLAIAVAVVGRPSVGQAPSSPGQPPRQQPAAGTTVKPPATTPAAVPAEQPAAEESTPKKKRAFRGRLPAYYGQVVDEEQRKMIYAVQMEYAPKIDALKAQLATLIEQQNQRVTAVLTPEQLKQVEDFKAAAKAKRQRAKGGE